ncbi:hypothetical protein NL676_018477 [Syzygium grande]|nr:hypothetical protein NL676_018477 [Syzygium grande]
MDATSEILGDSFLAWGSHDRRSSFSCIMCCGSHRTSRARPTARESMFPCHFIRSGKTNFGRAKMENITRERSALGLKKAWRRCRRKWVRSARECRSKVEYDVEDMDCPLRYTRDAISRGGINPSIRA